MNMSRVFHSYAKAYYWILEESKKALVYKDFSIILQVFEENRDLRKFFFNPYGKREEKLIFLAKVFSFEKETLLFFRYLIFRKRYQYSVSIIKNYIRLYEKEKNIGSLRLVSSKPLPDKTKENLSSWAKAKFDFKEVFVSEKLDTTLLSGFRLEIGEYTYEYNLKGLLMDFKKVISGKF